MSNVLCRYNLLELIPVETENLKGPTIHEVGKTVEELKYHAQMVSQGNSFKASKPR